MRLENKKKIAITIKTIIFKKKNGNKKESESDVEDDITSIASFKASIKTVGSNNEYKNSSLKFSGPQEKAFRKSILSEM